MLTKRLSKEHSGKKPPSGKPPIFKCLNKDYEELRRKRAQRDAKFILEHFTKRMRHNVDQYKRKEFNERIEREGNNLSELQIKSLNTVLKGDYRAHVMKETASVDRHLRNVHDKLEEAFDHIVNEQHYVEDTLDTWETGVNQFNKAIQQVAKRNNIKLTPKN